MAKVRGLQGSGGIDVSYQATGPLLERESELAELGSLCDATRDGSGAVFAVEGPAGIGKTRLLEVAGEVACSQGMTVLRARGAELEREFPFGVVRQLLEPALRGRTPAERRELLEGAAALAGPLFEAAPTTPAPGDKSFAVLHGLYWLCANLAESAPLLLAVDDGHWADSPSLRFLSYLVPRLAGLRIGLLIAARRARPGTEADLLRGLASSPATRLLRPSPLSETATAQLVRAKLGAEAAPEFCRACLQASGGNPFLLNALITALKADAVSPTASASSAVATQAPESFSRSVLWQLSRLPTDAVPLAHAVAVLGSGARRPHVAELASLETTSAAVAADHLVAAELLSGDDTLSFVHPLVESAVYAEISLAQRTRDHRRAARILAREGGASERVAAHLLAVEPNGDRWSVEVLRDAGRLAIERGAPESAVVYLRRALDEELSARVRGEVLRSLGLAEAMNDDPAGLQHLAEALALTEDAHEHGLLALDLARVLVVADRVDEAVPLLEREIAQLEGADRELAMRLEAQLLGAGRSRLSTAGPVRGRTSRFGQDLEGDTPAERALLAMWAVLAMLEGGTADQMAELAGRAFHQGELLAEQTADSQVFYSAGAALYLSDRLEAAIRWFDAAIIEARRRGSLIGFALASSFRGQGAYYCGHLPEAVADARAALDAAGPGAGGPFDITLAYLIEALIERGELAAAEGALEARALPGEIQDSLMVNCLLASRGRLKIARGDLKAGVEDVLASGSWFKAWGAQVAITAWRSTAALGLIQLGERHRARELVSEEVEYARAFGAPRPLGLALRVAGLVEGGEQGMELLAEAVAALDGSPARLERAWALTELGAALRRCNERQAARERLLSGLDLAERCGATVLAERAIAELRATGARPRRRRVSGFDALTPTERRVAQAAAEGGTNAEVAQALFVSAKTVDTHLQHAYQKLGVHSRSELRQALDQAAEPHENLARS